MSKIGRVPKVFSKQTLEKFEAASASIPLRQLVRAFEAAAIRPGKDPGGLEGARKVQFRRYIAGVDQRDAQQLDRLGDALGALIAEVAGSKEAFLVQAAERDGFSFVDGAFRPADTTPSAFAVSRVEDLASIDDRGRRLDVLADDDPADAIGGAKELVESVCRTVLVALDAPSPPKTADLAGIVKATVGAFDRAAAGKGNAKEVATIVGGCLQQLGEIVASLDGLRSPTAGHARLAAGLAVSFARFVADAYRGQAKRSG